jgi:peptidoglycan LD-endopeptidase LytH
MLSTRLILAWLHLLALAIGPAAVWARARALRQSLREPHDAGAMRRALTADAWWGVAAVLWLATGLWRLLGHTEKTTSYYFTNPVFYAKMGMFFAIVAMEIWPMMTLMRWRAGKAQPNPRDVGRIEVISYAECALVIAVVFAAVTMARGYGTPTLRSVTATTDSLRALGDPPDGIAAQNPRSATGASVPAPSGSAIATDADLELLSREIAMPIAGIDPAKLQSSFNDLRGGTRRHEALDIMSPRRTPVLAAAKGRLIKLFTSKAGGLMVYAADSSERFILMYGHLDEYAAGMRDGIALDRGELIGYVGSTGNALASAPHLHFAIARSADVKRWWMGTPVDPLPVLQQAANAR